MASKWTKEAISTCNKLFREWFLRKIRGEGKRQGVDLYELAMCDDVQHPFDWCYGTLCLMELCKVVTKLALLQFLKKSCQIWWCTDAEKEDHCTRFHDRMTIMLSGTMRWVFLSHLRSVSSLQYRRCQTHLALWARLIMQDQIHELRWSHRWALNFGSGTAATTELCTAWVAGDMIWAPCATHRTIFCALYAACGSLWDPGEAPGAR